MFYLRYLAAELRRRKGRTILSALGLAIGVGLVIAVSALSNGLDDAQNEILDPLTGVGTDLSVSRPISIDSTAEQPAGPGAVFGELSPAEQRRLERENEGGQVQLGAVGDPGERFHDSQFVTTDLSFPQAKARQMERIDGVAAVSGGLTLNSIEVSGRVPEEAATETFRSPGAAPAPAPENIDVDQRSVAGVDQRNSELALITPGQVVEGDYLPRDGGGTALINQGYASSEGLSIGDKVELGGERFEVIGIVEPPLGGDASDIYLPLEELQRISDRKGRINVLQVTATDAGVVDAVASEIESGFAGAQVTTAAELADRVSGSLIDAQNLSDKLGIALAAVALIAAFLIAAMLALSSVAKRIRELGTLKAIGWPSGLVVRQVAGESLAQGAIGGALGVLVGIGAAALISALGIELEATVAAAEQAAPGPFGQGQVAAGESTVVLDAPVDAWLLMLAIGLALAGGLIAGAVGATRAARLRPAEALRSVE
jgi:putative ABC transport system permease protein